jgi:enterochelin esterase family protein
MWKDDQGVWSATTPPLAPDYYGYSFDAERRTSDDPENPLLTPNLLATESAVHVPGPSSWPWELKFKGTSNSVFPLASQLTRRSSQRLISL